jgi:DNA-binding transcriptional LysR family regulator
MKVKQLEEHALIKPKKGWDYEISEFFRMHNISPHIKYEISDDLSIIALVQADFGINIMPELVLKNVQKGITALEFEIDSHRVIGISSTEHASPATKSFVSTVMELYQGI